MSTLSKTLIFLAFTSLLTLQTSLANQKPLKVYILAGQSNMEGHAKIETFDYIGEDPKTAPMLKQMLDANGEPTVSERVWISYFTGNRDGNGEGFGKLTAGYGSRSNPAENGGKIGPEFLFGLTMEQAHDGPLLIIKTAWGGKSLHTDFRPPGAGPYELGEQQRQNLEKRNRDVDEFLKEKKEKTGHYYRLMIDHVKIVLGDIRRVVPDYDEKQGYELSGFVWFQGWNDMVDSGTYPGRSQPGGYDNYSKWFAQFIRDVRKDLSAPKMPFVIGVMGVGGMENLRNEHIHFRAAMAAPAEMDEFKGTVAAVQTGEFWDPDLGEIDKKRGEVKQMAYFLRTKHKNHANKDGNMTPQQQKEYVEKFREDLIGPELQAKWDRGASNAGYHYLGCAKTFATMGKAFAKTMLDLEQAR